MLFPHADGPSGDILRPHHLHPYILERQVIAFVVLLFCGLVVLLNANTANKITKQLNNQTTQQTDGNLSLISLRLPSVCIGVLLPREGVAEVTVAGIVGIHDYLLDDYFRIYHDETE